ncbi:F-box/LRR-repeat protein 15 isoform X2 [Manihot esculenta]|uniref:F-box/LRR-repeat protein 15 isoform X2 n=1 Tax=Manihot esculenta TaxID=3983 RepID=UPI001CC4115C|nr:F-box/LRR-repeat protein 15 isoform X2 [Manihot esculenta]
MKIWCCLCFAFEDEEAPLKSNKVQDNAMREGILENDNNSESNIGNDVEDAEEAAATRLALALTDNGRERDDQDSLRLFEEMIRAMRGGGTNWDERAPVLDEVVHVVAPLALRKSAICFIRRLQGESSSSTAAAAPVTGRVSEDCDRDMHNKRAKVYSGFHDCRYTEAMSADAGNSSSSADRDFSLGQSSSAPSGNEIFYHNFMWSNSNDENPSDSSGGRDDEHEGGTSKSEDLEVRMDLTDDLLHMVFSFLDHINLSRAAMVCRQWRAASVHEDFWRCLNFENRNISIEQFEDMCQRYPNATEVNIHGVPNMHLLVMKAVYSLRNLQVLTLGRGQLGDHFFHALAECNMLKSLNVNDATLGNGVQEIPINHDRLHHLQLTKCRVVRISVRCPQLETLSLKRSNMAQAVLDCPLLHLLDIGSCHKLSDAAIRAAATSCPQLESLDMSNCSCVSDETLREIALTCVNLHILDASYCPNISLESVRLPMLTVLKLHSCEGIASASMAAISHSYMLEVLELVNCNLLTSVSLELPRLQNIQLVHCRKFADLNLRSIMLSSIMVSNCPALHRINITSNSLQKLSLQKQENLTTLALECQCLQEVDLTDCESLTNSVCEVFSDGGGCPMLRTLVLDNCEVALRSLNLGICPKLSMLNIEAPYMVSLELKGCGVLSEATINCPLLTSLDASFCSQLKDDCLSATTESCPLIESFILMSCPSVGSDGLYSLRWLPHLTLLDLSYTFLMNLQPVFESCLQLKVLKLQACKYLTDVSLEPLYKEGALPVLQELDLSYGTLCQSAIEELLACCTHLTHLSLNGCVNMHDLNWEYSGDQLSAYPSVYNSSTLLSDENIHQSTEQANRLLQNLNCVGCPNIRKVLIPPMACCFHLSSLNLSLSANLKEVDIVCFNLCFLNLSNCCSLEVLKLDCPRLTNLFLQSCNIDEEDVEAAISQCSMLETLDVRFCPKICSISMGRLRSTCPSLKRVFSSLSPP